MFSTIGYLICVPFSALLRLFYSISGSYGVSLILFTLVIKLILLPFQMKSKKSMIRMSRMSGRMQEIQKKYANNPAKQQEEMQKFYAEEGVNPMGGCLWSFLPLPVLMALYYIVREPIVYFMNLGGRDAAAQVLASAKEVISAAGVQLTSNIAYEQIEISRVINEQFPDFVAQHPGWVSVNYNFLGIDLSQVPGEHFAGFAFTWGLIGLMLVPVLSGFLSFLLSKVTMKGQPTSGPSASSAKMMIYMMPLMSVYIGFIMPAALGVYWIAQSAFSIVQESVLGKVYTQKLEAEEDERQKTIEASRKARQEEAKRLQEERKLAPKPTLKEKKKLAQELKAKAKKAGTNENGRVGDRPYARGRAYSENHYQTTDQK